MAKYSKARVEQIRGHLAELERRGVPVAQFANEIGVAAWTVYTWKRRFGCGVKTEPTKASPAPRAELIEVERGLFPCAIEVVVGAMTVRVPPGCDPSDLERTLRAVRSC